MTYKPSYPVTVMHTINTMGWEAMQLSGYIKHPPAVRDEAGNVRLDISPEELLRRTAALFEYAQDIKAFADAERAKVESAAQMEAQAVDNAQHAVN